MNRLCKVCSIEKPINSFRKKGKGKCRSHTCNSCHKTSHVENRKRRGLVPHPIKKDRKSIYNDLGEKKCSKCNVFQEIIQFDNVVGSDDGKTRVCCSCRYGKDRKDMISGNLKKDRRKCKRCKKILNKKDFGTNEEEIYNKRVCLNCYEENPSGKRIKTKEQKLKDRLRKFKLTIDEYNNLLVKQDNKCQICSSEFIHDKFLNAYRVNIDHCHTTNKVRGLLCNYCNPLIGFAKDSIEILQKAIDYLKVG